MTGSPCDFPRKAAGPSGLLRGDVLPVEGDKVFDLLGRHDLAGQILGDLDVVDGGRVVRLAHVFLHDLGREVEVDPLFGQHLVRGAGGDAGDFSGASHGAQYEIVLSGWGPTGYGLMVIIKHPN